MYLSFSCHYDVQDVLSRHTVLMSVLYTDDASPDSGVHEGLFAKVHSQLERYADVVFHAANLSAECGAAFAEYARSLLELQTVNCHLVCNPTRVALWVFGEEWLEDVYPLFTHHRRRQHGHLVLDFFRCEDAIAFACVVDTVARVGYM